MKTEGTTATSTEVQRAADCELAVLTARDAELIATFKAAAEKAVESGRAFAADVVEVAHAVAGLHQEQTWSRQVDPETGKPFTSAKSYYEALFESGESPLAKPGRLLQKVLRQELVQALMDPDNIELILGNNELAALCGVNQGTISRDIDEVTPALEANKEAADLAAAREEELTEVAAEAEAAAKEAGLSDQEAAYAAEVARSEIKAAREAEDAEAEAAKAEEAKAAEAEADITATAKVVKVFCTSVDNVIGRDFKLTADQRGDVRAKAEEMIAKLDGLEAMIAKAAKKAEADRQLRAGAVQRAAADAAKRAAAKTAGAAKPGPAARGGRKAANG